MKYCVFSIALAVFLVVAFETTCAQSLAGGPTANRIVGLALPSPTQITLRWAPSNPRTWDHGNIVGYIVERMRVTPQGEPDPAGYQRIPSSPFKAWTLEEWRQRAARDDSYAPVAAQALYGKSFIPQGTGPVAELSNRAAEAQNRFTFSLFAADMSPTAATGMGLRFVDENVVAGSEYMYRIFVAAPLPDFPIDTAYVLVKAEAAPEVSPPADLRLEPGDRRIILTWSTDSIVRAFSGYWVERSDDNGKSYRRLHNRPLVFLKGGQSQQPMAVFNDTSLVNYRPYKYRMYGITPFATLSKAGEIEGFSRDLTPPPPPRLVEGKHLKESTVRLRWEVEKAAADLKSFRIGISNLPDGPFEIDQKNTMPAAVRETTDSRAVSNARNYYVVVALDTARNASASMPLFVQLIDSIPPASPVGLSGEADTTGRVTMRWRLGAEPDLMGYRVYTANNPDHVFTLIIGSPVADTVFVDTVQVRTLTRNVHYRVVALDRNYNPSPPSQILRISRPDVIPPVAPVFKQVTPTDSSVMLAWIPSSSRDVRSHSLYRRLRGTIDWDTLAVLDVKASRYDDRNVVRKQVYEYSIQAQDSSRLRSSLALPVQARPYDTGKRPGIVELRAAPDTTRKVIRLSWAYPKPAAGEYWFVIYRSAGGEPLLRYRSAGAQTQFEDIDTLGWEKFQYAVQVKYRDGGQSAISAPVELVYRPGKRTR